MAENKIKYGIKSCYYAVASIASDGSATYTTPVAIPGAVSLSLDAQGERTPFYADNIEYWVSNWNNGYEGDLTVARLPDAFRKDVLGEYLDGDKLLVEKANVEPIHFALLFQFEGDQQATKHVLYNCTASRPAIAGNTKEDQISPETEAVTITAKTIYVSALSADVVKAKTTDATGSTSYAGWYSSVVMPTAATP